MKVLITGINGQDGRILTPILNELGFKVFGLLRNSNLFVTHSENNPVSLIECDLGKFDNVLEILQQIKPDLIVNFAAFSSVKDSWNQQDTVFRINYELPLLIFNWIASKSPKTRFIQASSSEIFGSVSMEPQDENTPLRPLTPYGHSKAKAHEAGIHFREKENLQITNLILYNHESLIRSPKYVSRHVSLGVAAISLGLQDGLEIGNIAARRDWGWAHDYMNVVSKIVRTPTNTEFVLATGRTNSVAELLRYAFASVGIEDYMGYVKISASELRMADPVNLKGNPMKAKEILNWEPTKLLEEFIPQMVQSDIEKLRKGEITHGEN